MKLIVVVSVLGWFVVCSHCRTASIWTVASTERGLHCGFKPVSTETPESLTDVLMVFYPLSEQHGLWG